MAVGIRNDEDYRGFHNPDYRPPGQEPEHPEEETPAEAESERRIGAADDTDTSEAQTWDSELPPLGGNAAPATSTDGGGPERGQESGQEPHREPEIDPILIPPAEAETEITLDLELAPGETS
ncbi:MAG: hypothetical protein AAGL66_10825, partial [Pseudomonadota bacterium]